MPILATFCVHSLCAMWGDPEVLSACSECVSTVLPVSGCSLHFRWLPVEWRCPLWYAKPLNTQISFGVLYILCNFFPLEIRAGISLFYTLGFNKDITVYWHIYSWDTLIPLCPPQHTLAKTPFSVKRKSPLLVLSLCRERGAFCCAPFVTTSYLKVQCNGLSIWICLVRGHDF